ncbi:SUMO-conjugating enzyme ubc9 [Madurella mycetomatis]|uniref:SUMO-conjugating enzyme ubc9 n=1 Tax=Madurella mycetomatis TaxID=100816 RepID=A0A175VTQ5_9PEZI|nr:SUMO-conjugating enzyme ubc9 [Madurella mycetomatis]
MDGAVSRMPTDLRKRLLRDITELKTKPYPNIELKIKDDDLSTACLILTPEGWEPLHLSVFFHDRYPLSPPRVRMDTSIIHPNVFSGYICASILNTHEGYTPAYTLKGIAIQLLSFFGSDSLEQAHGGTVDLGQFRGMTAYQPYHCRQCHFRSKPPKRSIPGLMYIPDDQATQSPVAPTAATAEETWINPRLFFIDKLPPEVILRVLELLDFEDLTSFSRAWERVSRLITYSGIVRLRELQCFVLKESHQREKLGVGVCVVVNGRQGNLQSEFDLISNKAYRNYGIRESIHGIRFQHWLPLPLSHRHWRQVGHDAQEALRSISKAAKIKDSTTVLYTFMNDIVVRLNSDLQRPRDWTPGSEKSTLRHASEKAIESYFHLFHLLLCLATGPGGEYIVQDANRMIRAFMSGITDKQAIPSLGYLLIALLISDIHPTEALMKAIVKETIIRNVVWMLDRKGAGMAELGYLESDAVSAYRLKKTFEGSRTSYRLLMFSQLFRATARPSPSESRPTNVPTSLPTPSRKSLTQLRDELFARHGAPPPGTAVHLASEVRRLQQIDDFPSFLKEMGVEMPSASTFTAFLRHSIKASADKGYSKAIDIYFESLASLRIYRDPDTDRDAVEAELRKRGKALQSLPDVEFAINRGKITFFPGRRVSAG